MCIVQHTLLLLYICKKLKKKNCDGTKSESSLAMRRRRKAPASMFIASIHNVIFCSLNVVLSMCDYMFRVILKWQFKFAELVLCAVYMCVYVYVWHNTDVNDVFFFFFLQHIMEITPHTPSQPSEGVEVWINFKSLCYCCSNNIPKSNNWLWMHDNRKLLCEKRNAPKIENELRQKMDFKFVG